MSNDNHPSISSGKKPQANRNRAARRRTWILIGGAVSAVFLICVTLWSIYVRPPDLTKPTNVNVGVKDKNNDDKNKDDYNGEITEPFIEEAGKTRKEDYFTFLLCGTDKDGTRTDTIIVASYDVKSQKINMVNIPRDTMSNVKRAIKKINGSFYGGSKQLKEELQMLLGMTIDRTVVINLDGFVDLVNAIGGVDFNVPVRMLYTDPAQDLYIDLVPGMQHLDGEKAIQFVRFRKNNPGVPGGYKEGDIGRIRAQQEFIQTIAKKLLSPGSLLKISDIASAVLNNTDTDMTMGELMWFGTQAINMSFSSIEMSTLPGHDAYLWEPDFGYMQSYYVPEREPILEAVNEKLNPYNEPITKINLIDVSKYSTKKPSSGSSGSSNSSGKENENSSGQNEKNDNEQPESPEQPSPDNTQPPTDNTGGDQGGGTTTPEGGGTTVPEGGETTAPEGGGTTTDPVQPGGDNPSTGTDQTPQSGGEGTPIVDPLPAAGQ